MLVMGCYDDTIMELERGLLLKDKRVVTQQLARAKYLLEGEYDPTAAQLRQQHNHLQGKESTECLFLHGATVEAVVTQLRRLVDEGQNLLGAVEPVAVETDGKPQPQERLGTPVKSCIGQSTGTLQKVKRIRPSATSAPKRRRI